MNRHAKQAARVGGFSPCARPRSLVSLFVALGLGLSSSFANAAPPDMRDEPQAEPSEKKIDPLSTIFWLNGGVGYGNIDLTTFEANGDELTAGLVPTRADGPAADLGVGFRIVTFTIGARAGVTALNDDSPDRSVEGLQLWSADLELGFRIPLGRVEPHFFLAGGYSVIGGLGDAVVGVRQGMNIDGANVRAGAGLDWFVAPSFSLGARVAGEALFLSRRAVPIRDLAEQQKVGTISEAKARILEADGSSAGTAYTIVLGPGLHF
jgi:hypothetical protein